MEDYYETLYEEYLQYGKGLSWLEYLQEIEAKLITYANDKNLEEVE